MRILITTGIFPPDIGGPATYVPRIATALTDRGHEVTVVAPHDPGTPCPITDPAYRLVRFPRADVLRYANYLIELRRATATILEEAQTCDLMYVNGLSLASATASRLSGRPMVVKIVGDGAWELAHNRGWTTANLDDFQRVSGPRIALFRASRHAAAQRARTVIVPSRYLGRIVEQWSVARDRIEVVYNAFVAPDHQGPWPEVEIPARFYNGFRVLTVGRLVLHKRIADIIRVVGQTEGARLVVVGDGQQRDALQRLVAERGLTGRVFFTGQVSQHQVWGLMTRYAQAIVLNSTYEGFPHILLEAAHFGVPIVATAVGGTPEIVEHGRNGLLVAPESPQELLQALETLAGDVELRQRLADRARDVSERFAVERMIDETERVLIEAAR